MDRFCQVGARHCGLTRCVSVKVGVHTLLETGVSQGRPRHEVREDIDAAVVVHSHADVYVDFIFGSESPGGPLSLFPLLSHVIILNHASHLATSCECSPRLHCSAAFCSDVD